MYCTAPIEIRVSYHVFRQSLPPRSSWKPIFASGALGNSSFALSTEDLDLAPPPLVAVPPVPVAFALGGGQCLVPFNVC